MTLNKGPNEAYIADVAVKGKKISKIGEIDEKAKKVIDAKGKIVTPGFVDIHTHYDGQAIWDSQLKPSSIHGVTTVVMGNCGVGFAPVKPGDENFLIQLMEGVEDIPGSALHEGIEWDWETFPEYLDVLDNKPLAIDVGTQIPHGAVRAYVMGERGINHEPASDEEISFVMVGPKVGIAIGINYLRLQMQALKQLLTM